MKRDRAYNLEGDYWLNCLDVIFLKNLSVKLIKKVRTDQKCVENIISPMFQAKEVKKQSKPINAGKP